MGGVITHLIVALLCAILVQLIHFKWEYSLAIFVGNFLPDVIKVGITALKLSTLNLYTITTDQAYLGLRALTSDIGNWLTWGFFIIGLTLLLYHFHYIKKRTMKEYDELYIFLILGVIVHLIIDMLILEHTPWI